MFCSMATTMEQQVSKPRDADANGCRVSDTLRFEIKVVVIVCV